MKSMKIERWCRTVVFLVVLILGACAQSPVHPGAISVNGLPRDYSCYIPSSVAGSAGRPLFMLLHGRGGSGNSVAAASNIHALADSFGFIAVFPDAMGVPARWNYDRDPLRPDDVRFLTALIEDLKARHSVREVYIGGYSSGGYMAYTLARAIPESLGGIAVVSGVMNEPGDIDLPVIAIHGSEDRTVAYSSARVLLESRAKGDRPANIRSFRSGSIELERIAGPTGRSRIDFFTFHGAGHSWPSARYIWPEYEGELGTLDVIWKFFRGGNILPIDR